MRSVNLSGDQTHVPKISLQRDTKVDFTVFEVKLFWLAWKPTSNASCGRAGHLIMVVGGSSPGTTSPFEKCKFDLEF